MEDRNNTIAGWILFGGICVLGFSILSGKFFHADNPVRPEVMGYPIEGVESAGAADSGPSLGEMMATADIVKGEAVFKKCVACHTIQAGGANGVGPNVFGILGRQHAGVAGFAYSSVLKEKSGEVWTFENMDAWLKSPRKYANGTKMSFAGLSKAEDRANVIAYMNDQGSNLPLPAVEAKPAEEAAPEGAEPALDGAEEAADEAVIEQAEAAATPAE